MNIDQLYEAMEQASTDQTQLVTSLRIAKLYADPKLQEEIQSMLFKLYGVGNKLREILNHLDNQS